MMKLEATKNQKIMLFVLGGVLSGYLLVHFILLEPFKTFQKLRAEEQKLNQEIEELFKKHQRLQQAKHDYHHQKYYLKTAKQKLWLDASDLLNLLTQNSPVSTIYQSLFGKSEMISNQREISRLPFSITFSTQYQKIGEYLLYQEAALPISHVESIEIRPDPKVPNFLEVKLSGKVYEVH